MRSLVLWAAVGLCLAAAQVASGAEGGAEAALSAQERAKEYVRLNGELAQLFARKNFAGGVEVCRKMCGLMPRIAEPHYNLACCLAQLGKNDEALAALAKAADLGFSDAAHAEKDDKYSAMGQTFTKIYKDGK